MAGDAHAGSCLCGGIRFVVHGALMPPGACHCRQCRKQSGHIFVSTNVALSALAFEGDGRPAWYPSSDVARRGFCPTCGSVLFWNAVADDRVAIAMGAFEAPTGVMLADHIHVAEKGDYYRIDDGLPQSAGDG